MYPRFNGQRRWLQGCTGYVHIILFSIKEQAIIYLAVLTLIRSSTKHSAPIVKQAAVIGIAIKLPISNKGAVLRLVERALEPLKSAVRLEIASHCIGIV